jgi:VWFA-related protein
MARLNWISPPLLYTALVCTGIVCPELVCNGQALSAQDVSHSASSSTQLVAQAPDAPSLVPRSHEDRERSYRAEHRVVLNVLVTDDKGKPASGLAENDFVLLDNSQDRQISAFRAANGRLDKEQVHVILVLDSVNNSARTIAAERKEIEKYLSQNRGKIVHPISLAMLSGSGAEVEPPSRDADVLLGNLGRLTQNPHGIDCADEANSPDRRIDIPFTRADALSAHDERGKQAVVADCLNRRFLVSVTALDRIATGQVDVPGRAIVIWLGKGWPILSGPLFAPDSNTAKLRRFDYLVELSTALREAQVTLDAVSFPELHQVAEQDAYKQSNYAPPTPDAATTGDFALPVLVRQTGGRMLEYGKNLAGEIAASIADAETYYVLSFDVSPAAGGGEYHALEVKVTKPGLSVRTNAAYFAQP